MSAIDRVRALAAAWHLAEDDGSDSVRVSVGDLDALLPVLDAHRARADAAEAECARLRGELAAVRRAVRMLDGARAAIDATGQRVLRSLAGEERAALLEELAAARRERDDWNASATAMEDERDEARAALADNELILEQRERQLTDALTSVAAERARCAAVCREVADIYRRSGCACAECEGHRDGARECAEEIECGLVNL